MTFSIGNSSSGVFTEELARTASVNPEICPETRALRFQLAWRVLEFDALRVREMMLLFCQCTLLRFLLAWLEISRHHLRVQAREKPGCHRSLNCWKHLRIILLCIHWSVNKRHSNVQTRFSAQPGDERYWNHLLYSKVVLLWWAVYTGLWNLSLNICPRHYHQSSCQSGFGNQQLGWLGHMIQSSNGFSDHFC